MNKKNRYPIRRVFILDEIAIFVALLLALVIRFPTMFGTWHQLFDGFYVSFGLTLAVFNMIVFLLYDNRKTPIFEQDPIENLITVFKSRCILLGMSLLYLYIVQKSMQSSRVAISLFFAFSVILGFGMRVFYKKHHLKKHGSFYIQKSLTVKEPYPSDNAFIDNVKTGKYDCVVVSGPQNDLDGYKRLISTAEKAGIRTFCTVENMGYIVRPGIVSDIGEYATIPAFVRANRFSLFGVNYSIARTEEAVLHVIRHVKELSGQYICFSNVHTSVMARESADYAAVLNDSAFTFPDGSPIATLQRKSGLYGAERVAGPDFMEHMFRNTMDGSVTHFFYGSSQETLDALRANLETKYPGLVIKGMYSPPFRELSHEEDAADIEMINASDADIIWIGLGAPKQERWMREHKGRINGIMMGVGAGFDFHAGSIKRAPVWIQKIGFEWLYRLVQDPKRLIKRYVITNLKFFWYLIVDKAFDRY